MHYFENIKYLTLFILLTVFGQSFGACVVGEPWGGAEDVQEPTPTKIGNQNYYVINCAAELAWFAQRVNATTANNANPNSQINAILEADIDLGGHLWTPIAAGKGETLFKGTFDGQGHKISGLFTDGEELAAIHNNGFCNGPKQNKPNCNGQNVGFIGSLDAGGVVKDLVLEVVDIQASNGEGSILGNGKPISVGSLVGWQKGGTISGIYVSGSINTSGKGQGVGGLVGNAKGGTIENSVSDVAIYVSGNEAFVGGIVGYVKGSVEINSCAYIGTSIENTGTGGTKAGVVGNVYKDKDNNGNLTATNTYYDTDVVLDGVGTSNGTISKAPNGVSEINSDEVVCGLNGGTWTNGACEGGADIWSVGQSEVSLNGSDGFTVTFYANGEEASFPENAKTYKAVAKGAVITDDEISKPTRTGFKFAGWATTSDATEPSNDLGTATKATKIYAVWYDYFEITFNAGTGHFSEGTAKKLSYAKGDLISLDLEVPEKDPDGVQKYSFAGWKTEGEVVFEADDDVVGVLDLTTYTVSGAVVLYPAWSKAEIYTVKYNGNGHGVTQLDFVNVSKGDRVTAPPNPTPAEGYKYDAWCREADCVNEYNFDTDVEESFELFAKWSVVNYTISYDYKGGEEDPEKPNLHTYNINTPTFVLNAPVKACHDFIGWHYADDNSIATQITQGTTGNKSLVAEWSQKVHFLAYMHGAEAGVSGTTVPQEKLCGVPLQLKGPEAEFVRAGYEHVGWVTEDGKEYAFGAEFNDDAVQVLYPRWEIAPNVTRIGAVTIKEYATRTEAIIDGDYAESGEVEISSDIVVNSVTLNRSFNVNKISTLYVPFEIPTADVKGASIYKFNTVEKSTEDGRWKFRVATTETVKPNTPYVVLPSASQVTFDIAGSETLNGSVTLNTTTAGENTSSNHWEFNGVYAYTVFTLDTDNPIYLFANQECDGAKLGQFVRIKSGAWTNPMRAYLVYHKAAALSKSVSGNLGGNMTLPDELDIVVEDEKGIAVETGTLNTITGEFRMDRWFDLKGRRLNSKPTVKGTYYKNGKKVIIK